jgi:NADH-quinone oxidoreductase subunit M
MLNHGLTTGALFACVGVIYERYHTREMAEMGGLWDRLPLWTFFLILAALGSAALPGLNGFVGEFPILLGMYGREPVGRRAGRPRGDPRGVLPAHDGPARRLRAVAGAVRARRRRPRPRPRRRGDAPRPVRPLGWHEIAGLTPLDGLIVAIGVYPRPFFERIRPAVGPIALNLDAAARQMPPRAVALGTGPGPSPGPTTSAPSDQDRAR